jgi:hypothetical protein
MGGVCGVTGAWEEALIVFFLYVSFFCKRRMRTRSVREYTSQFKVLIQFAAKS